MIRSVKPILVVGLAVIATVISLSAQVVSGLGGLPLYFEARPGPTDGAAQFLARSRDGQVLVSPDGFQISLRPDATVQARFIGASPQAQIQGAAALAGKINYLTGNNPARWQTSIPTFAQVSVGNLYPGVTAVYYGNDRQLEYDLTVAPGTDPAVIRLRFNGAEKVFVNAGGELVLSVGRSEIRQPKPVIYQTVAGVRRDIPGGYKTMDAQTVTFAVAPYDHRLPLVIDPILSYSTYFGGTLGQAAWAVAINTNDGSVFIAGQTLSTKFFTNNPQPFSWPTNYPTRPFQTNFQGGIYIGDAFVAKLTSNYTLAYLTYLGGTNEELANCLAVDALGHAFVGGYTVSPDFPVVTNINGYRGVPGISNMISGVADAHDGYFPFDGFVAELAPDGSSLIYSTFLGGSLDDAVYGLAIDGEDNVYVTGYTFSTNLPVKNPVPYVLGGSTNHFLNRLACTNTYFNCNAFVAKISNWGTNLDYLTYFGGNNFDVGYSIAVDSLTNVYLTGFTASTNFPTTNAFQLYLNNPNSPTNSQDFLFDAFVAKFAQTGTNLDLVYSSYLGGTNDDEAFHIAVDNNGGAYVAGWTSSTNFYNTTTNYINLNTNNYVRVTNSITKTVTTNIVANSTNIIYPLIANGMSNITYYGYVLTTNAFLTKITQASPTNRAEIAYSVVFGGRTMDVAYGVAVDPAGNAFVAGSTTSTNFPVCNYLGLLRGTNSSGNFNSYAGYNAFVTAFNPDCTRVLYSAYLGGTANDRATAIAVDADSTAYVVGQASSTNFPVTTASTNFPTLITAANNNLLEYGTSPGTVSRLNGTNDAFLSVIRLTDFVPEIAIARTGVKTNTVTLSWLNYPEPEIGPFGLLASTNLANTNRTIAPWQVVTNVPKTNNNTLYLTLPATNRAKFFRLYQGPVPGPAE